MNEREERMSSPIPALSTDSSINPAISFTGGVDATHSLSIPTSSSLNREDGLVSTTEGEGAQGGGDGDGAEGRGEASGSGFRWADHAQICEFVMEDLCNSLLLLSRFLQFPLPLTKINPRICAHSL